MFWILQFVDRRNFFESSSKSSHGCWCRNSSADTSGFVALYIPRPTAAPHIATKLLKWRDRGVVDCETILKARGRIYGDLTHRAAYGQALAPIMLQARVEDIEFRSCV